VLYALAAGRPVFEGSATGVLRQQRRADPEPPSRRRGARDLAFRAFDKIILRCLAKRPEQRYERAAELAADLARLDAVLSRRPTPEAGSVAPEDAARSGPRAAAAPAPRTVQRCSPRRPPKPRGRTPALPKVIVQDG
ncbi:MAG TPA: hypothetical protein VNN80_01945, partial [Polyangiaceae bacterium]|nr:hypothetical protein [Polyangiaceae bacterium]